MNKHLLHIKNWVLQNHEGLTLEQIVSAVVRMCDDADIEMQLEDRQEFEKQKNAWDEILLG